MKASNPSKAQKNNEQWLSTFDAFCAHLSENEFSHESWFRTQQKQAKDGTLLDERSERLENALGDDWSRLNITVLKTLFVMEILLISRHYLHQVLKNWIR